MCVPNICRVAVAKCCHERVFPVETGWDHEIPGAGVREAGVSDNAGAGAVAAAVRPAFYKQCAIGVPRGGARGGAGQTNSADCRIRRARSVCSRRTARWRSSRSAASVNSFCIVDRDRPGLGKKIIGARRKVVSGKDLM